MQSSEQNNELKTITINELRQFSTFKNISEQQALELISSLKTLALITHKLVPMSNLKQFQSFAKQNKRKTVNNNNAVIYTRVSDPTQSDNTSLESQREYCTKFAEHKQYNILNYFGGTYESAKTDDRKEFQRMLTFVRRKKVAYIIVYSIDRFSRAGASAISVVEALRTKGVNVLSVTQPIDTETSSGSLFQNINLLFSKYDNDLRRDKTITGMQQRANFNESANLFTFLSDNSDVEWGFYGNNKNKDAEFYFIGSFGDRDLSPNPTSKSLSYLNWDAQDTSFQIHSHPGTDYPEPLGDWGIGDMNSVFMQKKIKGKVTFPPSYSGDMAHIVRRYNKSKAGAFFHKSFHYFPKSGLYEYTPWESRIFTSKKIYRNKL